MMSKQSNSLETAMAAILVHYKNLLRLCTKMATAKGCMQILYSTQILFALSYLLNMPSNIGIWVTLESDFRKKDFFDNEFVEH